MRILSILVTLALSFDVFGQHECDYKIDTGKILLNENLDGFLSEIQSANFKVSFTKKDIPSFILDLLDCLTHDFSIANPNEEYQATDVIYKKLPRRKLLFLGKNKKLLIMSYLSGGFGVATHMLFIRFDNDKIIDLWTGVCLKGLKSKSEILKYIKSNRNKKWGLNTSMIYL